MSNENEVLSSNQIDSFPFGDEAPPAGFDPNAKGYENIEKPGNYVLEVDDFKICPNHPFRYKDENKVEQTWVGHQLRPMLVIPDGSPQAGASIMDFLPIPTKGAAPMPPQLANRWANFLRGCGFKVPQSAYIPPGFKIHDILKKRTGVRIEMRDTDKGPRASIKYMGYETVEESLARTTSTAAPVPTTNKPAAASNGGNPAQSRQTQAPKTTPAAVNPDDL